MMTIDDWVGVVDRAIQMGGEDHVAIGTDFDRGPTLARGMRDVLRSFVLPAHGLWRT